MKVRLFIIIVVSSLSLAAWADDIPGKKCKHRDDCDKVELQHCVLGHCIWNGSGIDKFGCCYGDKHELIADLIPGPVDAEWIIYDISCEDFGERCAWSSTENSYYCVKSIDNKTTFYEDPTGKHPRKCDFTCHPRCDGKECGPDWCGGSCGQCPPDQECTKDGKCCTPHCDGKQCGPDGCGGTCGQCKKGQQCVLGQCVWPGVDITEANGCCYGQYAIRRDYVPHNGKFLMVDDCAKNGQVCAWHNGWKMYQCVQSIDHKTTFSQDPTGKYPRECDFTCTPDCEGKNCGDDHCGGSCGECGPGQVCTDYGRCCTPHCEGKQCGDDGCGGQCGQCDYPVEYCDLEGRCVNDYGCTPHDYPGCPSCACEECVCNTDPHCCNLEWDFSCAQLCKNDCGGCRACVPDCAGKECGDDGCHGQCGYCPKGKTCYKGKCVEHCSCGDRECGTSPCGDPCGECPEGQECTKDGRCCMPHCNGKECGDDGCGGSCGECPGGVCRDGKCVECGDEPLCEPDWECGDDGCGHECGYCFGGGEASGCGEDHFCHPSCVSYCPKDYECGDDWCGFSCGYCGPCKQCISHHCKPIPDCEAPEPVPDAAEDVHADRDAIEAADQGPDPGKPAADVRKDQANGNNTVRDTHAVDAAGPDTQTKSSGGGCSTGPGSASGIWLIFLSLLALLLRRRQGE